MSIAILGIIIIMSIVFLVTGIVLLIIVVNDKRAPRGITSNEYVPYSKKQWKQHCREVWLAKGVSKKRHLTIKAKHKMEDIWYAIKH